MRIRTRRLMGSRTSIYVRIDQLYGTIPAVLSIYDACQPDRRVNNDRAAPLPSVRTRRDRLERTSEPAYDRHWQQPDKQRILGYGQYRSLTYFSVRKRREYEA